MGMNAIPQQWLTQPRVTQRQRLRQPYLSSRKQPIRLSPRHRVKLKTSCRTSQRRGTPCRQTAGHRAGNAGRPGANAPVVADNAPSRDVKLTFAQIAPPPGSMVLRGINPNGGIEFGMRSDEVVSNAVLNLEYTPSPSLLPTQSQLKVYLNDELMDVLPVTKEQLGKKTQAQVPINPLFITDFNRIRTSLSATTAMSAKTRPATRCGWTSGVTPRCR